MTPELPDDAYLRWLYSQVAQVRLKNPSRTYWKLLTLMYKSEFVWYVPNDDNRASDGRALRYEFIEDTETPNVSQDWLDMGCSVLEMIIALSRRLSFEAEGEPRAWFWHLMGNLGLSRYTDAVEPYPERKINRVIDDLVWRQYKANGRGGLFPLKKARANQRNVEIWYQMSAYLLQ